jgi:hypothetical protein
MDIIRITKARRVNDKYVVSLGSAINATIYVDKKNVPDSPYVKFPLMGTLEFLSGGSYKVKTKIGDGRNVIFVIEGIENHIEKVEGANTVIQYMYGIEGIAVRGMVIEAENNSNVLIEYTEAGYSYVMKVEVWNGGVFQYVYPKLTIEGYKELYREE